MEHLSLLNETIDVIEKNLNEKITLNEIVSQVFFSKYHFQRLFRSGVGDSIMDYVKKRRLTLAAEELCGTDQTVLDIALKYGYGSNESFSRAFKSYHGITPNECRKYGIYHLYEKKNLQKESLNMCLTNSEILKNTELLERLINQFIVMAKQTAVQLENKAKTLALPNFVAIAEETGFLAERVQAISDKINHISNTDNVFMHLNVRLDIINLLNDVSFRLYILSFNINIQAARTIPEYRLQINDILNKYETLENLISVKNEKIKGLYQDFIRLLETDLKNVLNEKKNEVIQQFTLSCDNFKSLCELIATLNKKNSLSDKSFSVIAEEAQSIMNELSGLHIKLNTEIEDTDRWNEIFSEMILKIDNCAVRADILAFEAKLDSMRFQQDASYEQAVKGLLQNAEELYHLKQECHDAAGEILKLQSMYEALKSEPFVFNTAKFLDDIAAKCNILGFYTRLEDAKLNNIIDKDHHKNFNYIAEQTMKMSNSLSALAIDTNSTLDQDKVRDIKRQFTEIADLLQKEGEALEKKGGVVLYILHEYKESAEQFEKIINKTNAD